MKISYKIALLMATTLCVIVVVYYAKAPSKGTAAPAAEGAKLADHPTLLESSPRPSHNPNDLASEIRAAPAKQTSAVLRSRPPVTAPQPAQPLQDHPYKPVPSTHSRINLQASVPTITLDGTTSARDNITAAAYSMGTPVTQPSAQSAHYRIRHGDTFESIAEKKLGDSVLWVAIAKTNPLVDPMRLRVNQMIQLPSINDVQYLSTVAPASARRQLYVILPGDTLSAIARRHYGDPEKWHAIYNANRSTIGSNPNRIQPGTAIRIPPS